MGSKPMKHITGSLIALIILALLVGESDAQPRLDFDEYKNEAATSNQKAENSKTDVALQETEVLRLQLAREFLKKRLEFDKISLDRRLESLAWHHRASQVIFFLVIGIVALGMGMSYLHFTRGDSSDTKIEIGATGVAFSSQLVGLLVLFISLLFFYLYLVTVYPILELDATPSQGRSELQSEKPQN